MILITTALSATRAADKVFRECSDVSMYFHVAEKLNDVSKLLHFLHKRD